MTAYSWRIGEPSHRRRRITLSEEPGVWIDYTV